MKKIDIKTIRMISNKYSIFVVLIAMVVAMSFVSDNFFTGTNIINVLVANSASGLLAIGVAFTIISKGIDLSVGSIVGLSSVISASFVQEATATQKIFPNMGSMDPIVATILAVVAGLVVGSAIGIFNGVVIAYTKISPFIATLGTMTIARGFAYMYTNAYPVSMLLPEFKKLGQGKILTIPNVIIVLIVVIIIASIILNKTRFGKHVYSIGGNDQAARYAGINVEKNLVMVYFISGFLAALGGVLITARTGAGNSTLGEGYELDAIAAATIGGVSQTGGVGTIGGVVAGIFILGVLSNGFLLLGVSPYFQQVIKGIIIIGAVVFDTRRSLKRI